MRFLIRDWLPTITTSSTGVPKDMLAAMLVSGQLMPVVDTGRPYREGREMQDAVRIMHGRR